MQDLDGAQLGGRRLGDRHQPALQAEATEIGLCPVAQGNVGMAGPRREAGRDVDHHVARVGNRAGRGKLEQRDLDGAQLGVRRLGNRHQPALQAEATEIGLCAVAQGNVGVAAVGREAGRRVDRKVAGAGDSVAGRHVQGARVRGSQADRTAVDQADRVGSDACGRALERRPAALERSADQLDRPVDRDCAAAELQLAAGRSGDLAVDQDGVVADQLQRPGRCPVDVDIRFDDQLFRRRGIGAVGRDGQVQQAGVEPVVDPIVAEDVRATLTSAVDDSHQPRVEQQLPDPTARRAQVDLPGNCQVLPARDLDGSPVAAQQAAARGDRAVKDSSILGPNDHLAAVATIHGVRPHDRTLGNFCNRGVSNRRVCPLVVASDQHFAAAGTAGSLYPGALCQEHGVPEQVYGPAGLPGVRVADVDALGNSQRAVVAGVEPHASSPVRN